MHVIGPISLYVPSIVIQNQPPCGEQDMVNTSVCVPLCVHLPGFARTITSLYMYMYGFEKKWQNCSPYWVEVPFKSSIQVACLCEWVGTWVFKFSHLYRLVRNITSIFMYGFQTYWSQTDLTQSFSLTHYQTTKF